jgi:hypothetical protein
MQSDSSNIHPRKDGNRWTVNNRGLLYLVPVLFPASCAILCVLSSLTHRTICIYRTTALREAGVCGILMQQTK